MLSNKLLIILDMANSHQGSLDKGLDIIKEFHTVCKPYFSIFDIAIKFQYRDTLNSFIHPDYKNDMSFKYIKRFTETYLELDQYKILIDKAKEFGFLVGATPFDEVSVDTVISHNCNFLKIASCSCTDWELLQKVATIDLPIIISTAGVSLDELNNVYSFFKNRKKQIAFLHCRAEYPTKEENLELNQIDLLKEMFIDIPVGFSSHEFPDNYSSVKTALGKKIQILEKHIDLDCKTKNAYSCTPEQIHNWLQSITEAIVTCGTSKGRYVVSEKEKNDLQGLQRGMYAKRDIVSGEKIGINDIFFAIPLLDKQITASNFSKYTNFIAVKDIVKNKPITVNNTATNNTRQQILAIVDNVRNYLSKSSVVLPSGKNKFELSHHYGLEKFYELGATIITCLNREYAKKILVMLPKQLHPTHYHIRKEESFIVLYGEMMVTLENQKKVLGVGDILTVERNKKHSFSTSIGCVFEEISTTQFPNDSVYDDKFIMENYSNRKTEVII